MEKGYKTLRIYHLSHELAVKIHKMTLNKLSKFELYEEGSQIRRSSKSIVTNLVEGYGRRKYKKEYILFLTYALASCDETIEHLQLLYETESLKDEKIYNEYNTKYNELCKQIIRYIESIEEGHKTKKITYNKSESSITKKNHN